MEKKYIINYETKLIGPNCTNVYFHFKRDTYEYVLEKKSKCLIRPYYTFSLSNESNSRMESETQRLDPMQIQNAPIDETSHRNHQWFLREGRRTRRTTTIILRYGQSRDTPTLIHDHSKIRRCCRRAADDRNNITLIAAVVIARGERRYRRCVTAHRQVFFDRARATETERETEREPDRQTERENNSRIDRERVPTSGQRVR